MIAYSVMKKGRGGPLFPSLKTGLTIWPRLVLSLRGPLPSATQVVRILLLVRSPWSSSGLTPCKELMA